LEDISNATGGKFNFKVKIVQTDLNSHGGYYFGGESPLIFQNSSYISKLYYINSYPGAILAKEKIEDMPERYRRFIKPEKISADEIIKSLKKDVLMLANREDVGQNVFYSRISNPEIISEAISTASSASKNNTPSKTASAGNKREGEYTESDEDIDIELLAGLDIFDSFENFSEFEEAFLSAIDGDGEAGEDYENYRDDEEIRDILHLNNYYNSDTYKMSKLEYDFTAPGDISLMDDGSLEIKYNESEVSGFKDSYIQFLFHPNNKNIVTVRRKCFFDVWFTLEKGKRISIEQRGPYSGAVSTTNTKELINKMTVNGGEMRFVYINESDGAPSEMIFHSIIAAPAEQAEPAGE
jgi:hypothetical protein